MFAKCAENGKGILFNFLQTLFVKIQILFLTNLWVY